MMSVVLTVRRRMPHREERTARRARFAVGGDAAKDSRAICSTCNGVVEDWTYVRVVYSCCLYLRCALGFVGDSAHGSNGSNASSLADRIILTGRVVQAQRLFPEVTAAQEVLDLTRVTTTIREADADKDERSASAPQQNRRMPCGSYGENMEMHDRFGFSEWAVHPRFALNTAEGASDAGEDRFGIDLIGEAGRPRRGAVHLADFLPRLHMKIDDAASGSGGQQLRIARLWEDVTRETGDDGD